jgi:hypothetical protein
MAGIQSNLPCGPECSSTGGGLLQGGLQVLPMNPACAYQSDIATFFNINFHLESLFQDHAGVAPDALGGTRDSFPLSGNLSNTTIESKFKNISSSMTNHIRQNGQPINSPFATGKVLQSETCVHVRWGG